MKGVNTTRINRLVSVSGIVAAITLLAGCGPKPREAASARPSAALLTTNPELSLKSPALPSLNIEPSIVQACSAYDMPRAYFAYDSAELHASHATELSGLVACFTSGPLAGERLTIVGHADPRGSFEYNLSLGHRRAEVVRGHFEAAGLPAHQLATTSRGEMDAQGTNEASWAVDRRVDLKLGS